MERLAIISHNFFRANGFHKSRSPYGPAPQGSQLITLAPATLGLSIMSNKAFC